MPHHSNLPMYNQEEMRAIFGEPLGATGKFPEGKIHPTDEGELKFAITHEKGEVIFQFGKAVAWFALPPEKAEELADLLRKHAVECRKS
jgi:hypothetical protein